MLFRDLLTKIKKLAYQPIIKQSQSFVRPEQNISDITEEEEPIFGPSSLEQEEKERHRKRKKFKQKIDAQKFRPFSQEELSNIQQQKQGLNSIQANFIDQLIGQFNEQIGIGQIMTNMAYGQILDQIKQYKTDPALKNIPTEQSVPTITKEIPTQKDKTTELSTNYNKLPDSKETFDITTDEASFENIKDPQSPPKSIFKNVFLKGPQADAFIDRFGKDNIVNNPFFKAISVGAYNAASRYFSGADRFLPNDKKAEMAAGEIYTNIELALGRMDREFPESVKNQPRFKNKSLTSTLKDYRFVTLTRTILEDPTILNKLDPNIQQQVKDIFGNSFDKKSTKVDNIAKQLKDSPFANDMIILLNQLINEGNQSLFKSVLSQASWLASRQFQKGEMSFMGGEAMSSEGLKGRNKKGEETSVDISNTQALHPRGEEGPSRAEQLDKYKEEFDMMLMDLGAITTRGDVTTSIIDKIFNRITATGATKTQLVQWEKMKIYWLLVNKQLEEANNKINGKPSSFNAATGDKIVNECGSIRMRNDPNNPYKLNTIVSSECLGKSAREVGKLKIRMIDMLQKLPPDQVKQQLLNEYIKGGYTNDSLPISLINDDNFIKSTSIQAQDKSGETKNYIKEMYLPPVDVKVQGNRWKSAYQYGIIPYFSDILITFTQKQKEIMAITNPQERQEQQRQFDIMRKSFFEVAPIYTEAVPPELRQRNVRPKNIHRPDEISTEEAGTPEEPEELPIVNNLSRRTEKSRAIRGDQYNRILNKMNYPIKNYDIYRMLVGNKDLPLGILTPQARMAEAQYFMKEAMINRLMKISQYYDNIFDS